MNASKAANAKRNLELLVSEGICYDSKDGISYFATNTPDKYDFWPTTGAWFNKTTKQRGQGLESVIRSMKDGCMEAATQAPKKHNKPARGEVYVLKVNLSINSNFTCVSSRKFAVTDASLRDVREKSLADVTAAIDRELQRAKAEAPMPFRRQSYTHTCSAPG